MATGNATATAIKPAVKHPTAAPSGRNAHVLQIKRVPTVNACQRAPMSAATDRENVKAMATALAVRHPTAVRSGHLTHADRTKLAPTASA